MSTTRGYQAFLLRGWREQNTNESYHWRLSLHDVHSGEQYGFRSLDELCAYLRYRMAGADSKEPRTEIRFE